MGTNEDNVVNLEADEADHLLERARAIDVAKASGKVCVRLPHPSVAGRRPRLRAAGAWPICGPRCR